MIKLLGSVKLTIVLLVLLVTASIVGTLIPQTWTEQQYVEKYGSSRYSVLKNLQLTDVYHSRWFSALLAVFCIHLCICSLQSFGPLMKSLGRSSSTAGRVKLPDLPHYEKIKLSGKDAGANEAVQKVKDTLSGSFYRAKYEDAENGVYYFERGKLGRLGPLITHASVIIILIGGIAVATLGFKDYRNIPVGETIDVPHADFQLRADDFKVEFYPDRSPKEFTSVLTVIDGGVEKFTKTIEVNSPLKYKGIKFYQSSYGPLDAPSMGHIVQVELLKKIPGESDESGGSESPHASGSPHESATSEAKMEVVGKYDIHIGQVFQVPDSQLKINVATLIPDFVRDGEGHIKTRSDKPNNPAALLELYEGDEPEAKYRAWSFLKFPDFHGATESDYVLKFVSIGEDSHTAGSARYYTGLQIGYHPGLSIIWAGCLIMVAGMFISFYISFKRIWVRVSDGGVEMGGRSYKDRASFEKEFGKLKSAFE